ncbi:glycoside hydrolase family 13 protein [Bacillus alveayuensis]|uniref:glycoside hydrolase family 13 protein n=1 Tax=Aeribacillus alveayuensis TaxID=279215 RepID=UPI0005CCF334|nr:alpha-glucosidase [Bacillus alveayuensis]
MNDQWWKTAVFYEIYMPSFCDGNRDGIGDFAGITSKLDYLKELGVDGIWLTPFYQSPKVDNGYDISDYYSIDKDYGTMADFEEFIREAHRRDIKVIADLVLNHTSAQHPWFIESRSSRHHPKRDWYIWKDSVDGGTPNNWESFFGGSAWEYDEHTGQYYYHAFAKEQVDLNWANPEVRKAMFDVMTFWLEKGIDGFRLDVINFLKVNGMFPDNPYNEKNEQIHQYDKDQEGILDVIREIASIVRRYPGKFLVGEVGSEDLHILKKYSGQGLLDVVFNFNLGSIKTFDVNKIFSELKKMEELYTEEQIPTLFFSSHDMPRHISRFGREGEEVDRAKLIAALILTAKGVPFIYYGDEIGMRNLYLDDIKKMRDVQGITAYQMAIEAGKTEEEALQIANERGRDKSRSPMQWDDSKYAGFSEVEPWISISDDSLHVKGQRHLHQSMLKFYQSLIQLRKKHRALHSGSYRLLEEKKGVIYYIRSFAEENILIALNFTDREIDFALETYLTSNCELLLSNKREHLSMLQRITLLPYESLIMRI